MITKATVATVLGLVEADISDSVYNWAIQQFYLLLGLKASEVQKTYRKFMVRSTNVLKLPDRDIKSIDEIKIDGTAVTNLTEFVHYKLNPDSGLLWYGGGFGGSFHSLDGEPYSSKCFSGGGISDGSLIEVKYTINDYTHLDIHDYLISLLVAKALSIFTPDKVQQVRMVKIGKFQKQFGSASANSSDYNSLIDKTIDQVIDSINGDDGGMTVEGLR